MCKWVWIVTLRNQEINFLPLSIALVNSAVKMILMGLGLFYIVSTVSS